MIKTLRKLNIFWSLLDEYLVGRNRMVVDFSGWRPGQVDSSGIRTQHHGSVRRGSGTSGRKKDQA
jgi:hypothetical protein